MVCRKCGNSESIKNGKRGGMQCYKCKNCGFQYTKEEPRGRSESERNKAIALYLLGLSMRAIAKLFHVNVSTILYWIRNFAMKTYEKPTPPGPVIIELDEMWHFIKSKKNKCWIWKAYCRTSGQLVDWECGDRSGKTLKKLLKRLKRLKVVVFFADNWEAYAGLIPAAMLIQTKAETHGIERNNFRQRHWFGRFRRKTCIVSRSLKMVDLTMSLFARFHVNGSFDKLVQMFG